MESPYKSATPDQWLEITKRLVKKHPLKQEELVKVVLSCWTDIFNSKIGKQGFRIGKEIFPKPQIMGFLLHELIPLKFETLYPKKWRKEKTKSDKDLVFIPQDIYSIEIKTSSNPNSIFGNRSYAQDTQNGQKDKSGYYLAINFAKFSTDLKAAPTITGIRFGWLDHSDWMGQKASTGQQARLSKEVESYKLLKIYSI